MRPVRILHVVAQMNRGGIETWLMQVLRNVDPKRVRMDFLTTRGAPGHYDDEIESLGSAVVTCESPSSPVRFAERLLAVLTERGPYDVVHSHIHHFSGFVLAVARVGGVPVRVAHSHLDTQQMDADADLRRRVYLVTMTAALRAFATRGLAVSAPAAEALFGARWREDPRWEIARCGLDFRAFRAPADVASVRGELGIPPDAIVLGHVGRFETQKNHDLLLRIAAAAIRREARAFLVLVGDGPLRGRVEAAATRLGVRDRIAFANVRADVPRVLRAFDVFVLPSLREGLPLVGLEAQAAGLPIVLSDCITREVVVVPELFTWRSLADSPDVWAESALSASLERRPDIDVVAALDRSEFSLSRSLSSLLDVYERPRDSSPRRAGWPATTEGR